MNRKTVFVVFVVIFSALGINAQKPASTPAASGSATYETLLAKLKGGDTSIDFAAIRLAHTETKGFAPYGGVEGRKKINDAVDKKKYDEALAAANARLNENYLDVDAHFGAFMANRELGKSKEAEFHRKVAVGLVDAIIGKVDGKTAKTAYFVISISEEYFVMNYNGFRVTSQSVVREDGHTYDLLVGTNFDTKEEAKFYFNIDKVYGKF